MLIGSDFSGTEECDQSQRQGIACDERIAEKRNLKMNETFLPSDLYSK